MAERGEAQASTGPSTGPLRAFLAGSLGPAIVAVLVVAVVPILWRGNRPDAIVGGGLTGAVAALVTGLALGWWMLRSFGRGGTAFLAPLAGGFLVKLVVLAGGTLLVAGPLAALGSHVAFAISFAAAASAFQALFTPILQRSLRGARQ